MPPADYLRELFNLSGQVAVVIGGTGELCGAMAEGLAGAGAEVVLVGRNAEKASARLARLAALGGRAWFHPAEASSRAELEGLRDAVLQRSGRIDIVVAGEIPSLPEDGELFADRLTFGARHRGRCGPIDQQAAKEAATQPDHQG